MLNSYYLMKSDRENLEERTLGRFNIYSDNKKKYRSAGERILAEVFKEGGYNFTYEPRMYVEEKRDNDSDKGRLWYPDFLLEDFGIIVEYVGLVDDKDYMKGIEHKRKVYEDNGIKVVYITYADLFVKKDKIKLRKDYREIIKSKITEVLDDYERKKFEAVTLSARASTSGYYTGLESLAA